MNRALASVGIAAAVICGSATPALAADTPIDAKITYISSGSSQVSPSETPIPSTRPTKTAETPKTSETKLAKTGTYAGALAVLVPLIAAVGTIAYIASRKEDN